MSTNKKLHMLVSAAIYAAAITITTAYVLHIPLPTGGYVHLGDALIYLGACLMPTPWAMLAGSIGAGLADLLTAPVWMLPTLIIKAIICLPFTNKNEKIFCTRNIAAVFISGLVSSFLYSIANVIIAGTIAGFMPQFIGTMIQAIGSGIVFSLLAFSMDRIGIRQRLAKI